MNHVTTAMEPGQVDVSSQKRTYTVLEIQDILSISRPTAYGAAADEVQQNDAHFVAGNEPVAALSVRHGGAAAVAVGVGTDENIGVDAVAVLKAQLHGLPDLRIRIRA